MPQVLTESQKRRHSVNAQWRQVLILTLGFAGGTVGASLHLWMLAWALPTLSVKLPHEDLLVLLSPVVWWASAIATMGWSMKRLKPRK